MSEDKMAQMHEDMAAAGWRSWEGHYVDNGSVPWGLPESTCGPYEVRRVPVARFGGRE